MCASLEEGHCNQAAVVQVLILVYCCSGEQVDADAWVQQACTLIRSMCKSGIWTGILGAQSIDWLGYPGGTWGSFGMLWRDSCAVTCTTCITWQTETMHGCILEAIRTGSCLLLTTHKCMDIICQSGCNRLVTTGLFIGAMLDSGRLWREW
jgi:hypothetical protein